MEPLNSTRSFEWWAAYVAASSFAHFVLFRLFPGSPRERSLFASTIHAINCVVAVLAWNCVYSPDFWNPTRMFLGVIGTGDELMPYLILYSFGYFMYDFIVMIAYPETADWQSFVHHFTVASSMVGGTYLNVAVPYMFFFLIEELSTPFLNLKYFARNRPVAYHWFSVTFALTFLFSRMVCGSAIYLTLAYHAREGLALMPGTVEASAFCFMFACVTVTRALNLNWSRLILGKLFAMGKAKKVAATAVPDKME